jgi:hypothetical protein
MPVIPRGQNTTLHPPRLKNEPEHDPPKLEKPLRLFFLGRVPMPEGRPRPRGKGDK